MIERPTPETDKRAWSDHSEGILYEVVQASFARKLERERDKAQEDATNYYAKIGELEQERDEAMSQIVQAECRAERFCQERDEAREALRTLAEHGENEIQKLIKECDEARKAIIATLEENRHLADGDDCTLAKLKSVVPEWK